MKKYLVTFEIEEGCDEFWEENPSLKDISKAIEDTLYFDGWTGRYDQDIKIEVKQIED